MPKNVIMFPRELDRSSPHRCCPVQPSMTPAATANRTAPCTSAAASSLLLRRLVRSSPAANAALVVVDALREVDHRIPAGTDLLDRHLLSLRPPHRRPYLWLPPWHSVMDRSKLATTPPRQLMNDTHT
jgi:hypothetical protein